MQLSATSEALHCLGKLMGTDAPVFMSHSVHHVVCSLQVLQGTAWAAKQHEMQ